MREIILHLFEFLATYIEVFTGVCICEISYFEKSSSISTKILGSVIVSVAVWMLNQYQLFSLGITSVAIIGIAICTYSIHKELNVEVIFIAILYFALVYIIDFLSITIVGVLMGKTELANAISKEYSIERLYLLILSKSLLVVISKTLYKYLLSNISIQIRRFQIRIILLLGMIYYLVQNTFLKIDIDITMAWLFLLGLFLLSIYTAVQYLKHLEEKKNWQLNIERSYVLIENYDKLIVMYQEKQNFYHDLKNQYLIVGQLMKNKEYEKANEYLTQLSFPEYESIDQKRTGIRTIDILINYKIKEAEKYGISVETEIDFVELRFSEQEMAALLGNILDNAIEACRNITVGQRWIRIQIKTQYNMLFLKVSNLYEHKLNYKNGKFISSKTNPQQHGWGIDSIKMIAEKQDGIVKINTDGNIFTIIVSFFY